MARKQPSQDQPEAGMVIEVIPVGDLHLDPGNLRKHPVRSIEAIKASLARFGQQKPIVVDSKGVVRAGNGTLMAARELGWPTVQVVRSDLSGSDLVAYGLIDNRSAELSDWDDEALFLTLQSLQEEGVELADVGFTEAEMKALLGGDHPDDSSDAPADDAGDDWNPAIRFELVFDDVAQQDRWFGFMKWLKGQSQYEAETIAGRIDLFLRSGAYAA